MLALIKKVPWWGWIGIFVALIFIWQAATGAALTKKLYNTMLDQLRTDQTQIVEQLQNDTWKYKEEIAKKDALIAQNQKKIDTLTLGKAKSDAEVQRLKDVNKGLEDEIAKIIVSRDPDTVIKSLQQRFPTIKRVK